MNIPVKSEFLKIMIERGFVHQITDVQNLDLQTCNAQLSGYIGFDCTASSLHVGSLIQIMMLRWFQKTGNKPIVLMGGGTTKIGDPSGKDSARPVLSIEQIEENQFSIKSIFKKFLKFGNNINDAIMVDNSSWLENINYISFLRDFGSSFSINKLINLESVKLRLEREQNLSFLEFNYSLLQAYDFLQLNKQYGCSLQMGGSDQWGNIVNGVDLIKRYSNKQAYGLTTPLITLASGAKMGKTETGAVWLDKKFLSPYDYWQFWRNIDDRDVLKFLKIFTDLSIDEIEKIKEQDINQQKIILANKATTMLHSEKEAKTSEETAKKTFTENSLGSELPSITISENQLNKRLNIIDLIILSKMENSKSEIRRIIKNNGIKINNETIINEKLIITKNLFKDNRIKLSLGKKRHIKVILT